MYRFVLLDPRPCEEAERFNAAIFASGPVLGIEVTVPALVSRCVLGNIDPQHTGGDATRAAIEDALSINLPPEGTVFATIRPDLDSFGSMALLALRAEGVVLSNETLTRVARVAKSDTFARGAWPGQQPLPDLLDPWKGENLEFAAMMTMLLDHRLDVAERVRMTREWFLSGTVPETYREEAEHKRLELVQSFSDEATITRVVAEGKIAVVESPHREASRVGYSLAPVVVAATSNARFQGKGPFRKFSVMQYDESHIDMAGVLLELSEMEPGWGGSSTLVSSPQGVSSQISLETVLEVAVKHLK